MFTRNKIKTVLTLAVVVVSIGVMAGSVTAAVLVYEPFDYESTELTGQGGALGTVGTWNSNAVNDPLGWGVHQEGVLSGAMLDNETTPITFDGTVANLPTTGGYTGHGSLGYKLNADIALDPSVTASFTSGSTTWISYVSVRSFDKNQEQPNLTLGTIPVPDGNRGDNYGGIGTGGSGIGTGGGPNRDNRTHIYPMFYTDGQYNNVQGPIGSNSYSANSATVVDDTGRLDWVASDDDGYGAANIVIVKIQWDAGASGEDIVSLASFLEDDVISEAAFNAMIVDKPNLTTANWAVENQPKLDQSEFDTITFAGIKYFVDEIRFGTTFSDVIGIPSDPTLPTVKAGGNWITWSGESVTLDPNVINNSDPVTALTYAWSADSVDGVKFDSTSIKTPTVTITKAIGDAVFVTLTLAVNNADSGKDDVIDTMMIAVYDDACFAAKAAGDVVIDPTDFDKNCITDIRDFAEMAAKWLDDYSLTEPVAK